MEKIRVLIVEDDLLIAEDLKEILQDHDFLVTDIISSGEKAITVAAALKPDLILMDIRLSGKMDGIAAANEINQRIDVPIIYLTDHTDQSIVERAKMTAPAAYLPKPYRVKDLLLALELAFSNASKNNKLKNKSKLFDRIFIRTDHQESVMIPYTNILYIKAEGSYSSIVTTERSYLTSSNMKNVFEKFQDADFIKVHRSYIVNVKHITGIIGNMIKIGKDHKVQIGNTYKDEVLRTINIIK